MKIASFNIQKFGKRKLSDPAVATTLVQIVSRYDIVVILEVVDASGKAVDTFMKELNKSEQTRLRRCANAVRDFKLHVFFSMFLFSFYSSNPKRPFTMKISTRLGRTTYKEQFLFLYREDLVKVIGTYQYEDNQPGDEDAFDREPYILRFSCPNTVVKDIVMIPVHTKPDDSEKEIDELYDVTQVVKQRWKTDNIMILGDFNADGSYVSKKEMKAIRIFSDENFHWLITDDIDTTTRTRNDNTYDRIVVHGKNLLDAVVPNSAKPFNFQKEYGLTEADALKVSDHYPVEVELKETKCGSRGKRRKYKEMEEA